MVCYVRACKVKGMQPLCTCPMCDGLKTHHCACASPPARPAERTTLLQPSEKKRKTTDSSQPAGEDPLANLALLSPNRLIGKGCLLCGTKRSSASTGIPLIHVGQHRLVSICKKGHLSNENDCARTIQLLNAMATEIEKEGDKNINVFTNGSGDEGEGEDEGEEEEATEEGKRTCHGLLNTTEKAKCTNTTPGLLFITECDCTKHFCCASERASLQMTS
jgi:hypothetical protein